MLMFLIDLHAVTKALSVAFQREDILLIEVKPLVKRTLLQLENLRGGKGTNMLEFSVSYEETGQYKGVELNRARHATRSKTQARLEQFSLNKQENEEMHQVLFSSYDFYINFLTHTIKERFSPLTEHPISCFDIFDYKLWPPVTDAQFHLYGDKELATLLHHFRVMYTADEARLAKQEWLLYKHFAAEKLKACQQRLEEMKCNQNKEEYKLQEQVENSDSDTEGQILEQPVKHSDAMSAAELCFQMYRDRQKLELNNICLVLKQMIVMSPSNAHTERMVKAMNNIKTIHRTRLGQAKLNNQFKVAMNSKRGEQFNPNFLLTIG